LGFYIEERGEIEVEVEVEVEIERFGFYFCCLRKEL